MGWSDGEARLRVGLASVGSARVAFEREREGAWMGGRGCRRGGVGMGVGAGGTVAVVEGSRLMMRRGRGVRCRSVVGVVVMGWRGVAECLWAMEDGRTMWWFFFFSQGGGGVE